MYSGYDLIIMAPGDVNIEAVPPPHKAGRVEDPRIYLAAERHVSGLGSDLAGTDGFWVPDRPVRSPDPRDRGCGSDAGTFASADDFTLARVHHDLFRGGRLPGLRLALPRVHPGRWKPAVANPSVSTRTPLVMAAILVLVGLVMAAHILTL